MKFNDVLQFCIKHKYAVIYGIVGFISAILMLTIGFFPTLLILILVSLGITVGCLMDKVGAKGTWMLIKKIFNINKNR